MDKTNAYQRVSHQAHRFIESLCDLGYVDHKHRQQVFEHLLTESSSEKIELAEVRRLLAAFFFDGRIKLSQGQKDMLKREWAFLFG